MEAKVRERLIRDGVLSLFFYALPVLLMFLSLSLSGKRPWEQPVQLVISDRWLQLIHNLNGSGLGVFIVALGILEFSFGLYEKRWTRNEKWIDIVSFVAPYFTVGPFFAYFGAKVLPLVLPGLKDRFAWVPFFWGFLIICIADDLTQYCGASTKAELRRLHNRSYRRPIQRSNSTSPRLKLPSSGASLLGLFDASSRTHRAS